MNDEMRLQDAQNALLVGHYQTALKALQNHKMPEEALKILNKFSDPLCTALNIQCLLSMHRVDLAGKIMRRMQTAGEDSLPIQIACAMYYLRKGGDKLKEAEQIYQELKDKYGPSSFLLNGQAAALIGMNQWEDANSILQEAIDLDTNNADTIMNRIVVYQHMDNPNEANRLISHLKDCCKNHPFLSNYAAKEEEFDLCASQYASLVAG